MRVLEARFYPKRKSKADFVVVGCLVWNEQRPRGRPLVQPAPTRTSVPLLSKLLYLLNLTKPDCFDQLQGASQRVLVLRRGWRAEKRTERRGTTNGRSHRCKTLHDEAAIDLRRTTVRAARGVGIWARHRDNRADGDRVGIPRKAGSGREGADIGELRGRPVTRVPGPARRGTDDRARARISRDSGAVELHERSGGNQSGPRRCTARAGPPGIVRRRACFARTGETVGHGLSQALRQHRHHHEPRKGRDAGGGISFRAAPRASGSRRPATKTSSDTRRGFKPMLGWPRRRMRREPSRSWWRLESSPSS